MPVLSVPAYSLAYQQGLHMVVLRWLKPYTAAEARKSYQATLVLALQHGCARWLLDARGTGPLNLEVAEWLTHKFLPAVAVGLAPHPLRLAVICPPARFEQLHTDPTVAAAVSEALADERPYQAGLFYDEGAAVAWLMSQPG
ncbi:hypothetical protein [Hymenobacter negativus]|uniref:STAS/SEC14 domain-containing protein n=1 Tax=Hymenobacter negativus TaxID=2795026 RepID=A0ABS0Q687_9BACT|nr:MULTISPECIES: hypothetical protein [Bacteria]MBH8557883.1 hypothetical protein [Hymenobacter negativus]MBH8567582.1 hypothetical protein [Hymenobacter negativus]MBR7207314.1 hypothetical protein [Microvirga sp. STS02]